MSNKYIRTLCQPIKFAKRKIHQTKCRKMLSKFKFCGKNIEFGRNYIVEGVENMSFGNDIYIGPNAVIYSAEASLVIKDKVVVGPNFTLVTGDHNFKTIGKYIFDEKIKLPENDKDVIIESDVWIGANVTVLKGITIGRGSVIGANCLITKDVEPYSIMVTERSKCIKKRFTDEEIKEHEAILYNKK